MPKNKKVIAVDLDEVLSTQLETIRLFNNKHYGSSHTPEDYTIEAPYWRYFESVWQVDDAEGDRRVEHYISSGGLSDQGTVPGAIEAIKKLKRRFKLVIVTNRLQSHADETHRWLNRHFSKIFDDVRFTSVWGDKGSSAKAKISKDIGADYFIDDNLNHCLAVAEEEITCLLFGEYGWNREEVKNKKIIRVKNWDEVLEYFDAGR